MRHPKLRRYFRHGLLTQILVFEAVARLASVTRAAEELHLAQSTVSIHLKKLAETLGVVLFEQQGRQLVLTAGGHAMREVCADIMQCLLRAEERFASFRAPPSERITLAAEPEARQVAARLLAQFCARHPGVQASLYVAEREELLARCSCGTDDVYVFQLQVDGLPPERRWSIAHAKGRQLAESAAEFLRETLNNDGA